MDDLDSGYLMAVAGALVWTPRLLRSWLDTFGSPRALLEAALGPGEPGADRIGERARDRLRAIDDAAAIAALEDLRASGAQLVCDTDPDYPKALLDLCDPPPVLYVRGDLNAVGEKAVAIVGSRAATAYGRSTATSFARDFALAGVCVVSGLARGIDAAAHKAALDARGATVAVVGSGLCALYPPYHSLLADEIAAAGGAVISEFPPRLAAAPHQFPMRNRLVAALARATVVVEAGARSGALITARLADELGRSVFSVPGDLGRPTSEGTNGLIKDGVPLVTSARDACELLGWSIAPPRPDGCAADPLLPLIAHGAAAEEVAAATGLAIADVVARLALLEIGGLAERLPDGRFAAVNVSAEQKRRPR